MASPIASGGYVFVLNNGGLSCLDPLSGDLKFKERIPKTRTVAASPFSANGKLYFLDESGTFVVIKAAGEFEVVASNKIEDTFWSSPTPAGDQLLLRGVEYLYCIKK
jgi:outer membrane protein assembly factor BamB